MLGMETRMERYAKYREQIRRMPESDFPRPADSSANADDREDAPIGEEEERRGASAPYRLYLNHRRNWFLVKVGLLVVAVGLFILWWFLMQGRKPV